jgi:hypothetical protein
MMEAEKNINEQVGDLNSIEEIYSAMWEPVYH